METSLALQRHTHSLPKDPCPRRVTVIWALLFFNALTPAQGTLLPIPHRVAQLMTQGALVIALVLAVTINPRMRIRPNWYLGLYTVLAISSLMMSVRFVGLGTGFRSIRLIVFLFVLWLLTPWWGRRDLLLLRSQMRFLVLVLGSVVLGLLISARESPARWPSEWHALADLAHRGCALRGRGRWRDDVAVAVPSGIPPPCRRDRSARHDRPRPHPHTYGPPRNDRRPFGRRCQPVAGKTTGS